MIINLNKILGNSIGDDWSANYDDTKPFDKMDKLGEEIADNLHKQNTNARSMFAKVSLIVLIYIN